MSMVGEIINHGIVLTDWIVQPNDGGQPFTFSDKSVAVKHAAELRRHGYPKPVRVMRRRTLIDYPNGRGYGARRTIIEGPGA